MRTHEDSLLHKTNTDELQESGAASFQEEPTGPDAEGTVKKKKRRRSRRRRKGGSANAAPVANNEATAKQAEAPENGTVVPLPPKPRQEPPPAKAKPSNNRKRRGSENSGKRAGNGAKRQDIGSWRAEPPGERMRRRPGQAQTQSPSLWAGWSAAHFGKGEPESD